MKSYISSEMQQTARVVIRALSESPEFRDVKIVIVGGCALHRYLPGLNSTNNLDILVDFGDKWPEKRVYECPDGVSEFCENNLLEIHPEEFRRLPNLFRNFDATNTGVPILFFPKEMFPYMPAAAITIREASMANTLPYLSLTDVLIFKIYFCSMRGLPEKRQQDASNAMAVVEFFQSNAAAMPIWLSPEQRQAATEALLSFSPYSEKGERYWRRVLGL